MTITSGIFNSVNGDRKYDAQFFAQYFASFVGNGVFPNPSNGLQVTANQNMQTVVRSGKGWINGYYINNDSNYMLQHDVADGLLKRIDRVVMRLNYLTRQIEIVIKKGTNASSPVAPTLQRDTDYVELALADVLVTNGATVITQANITDQRFDSTLCGIVKGLVDEIDTTGLFAQYDSAFSDWFETLQNVLEGNVAANLQNQITALVSSKLNSTVTIDGVSFVGNSSFSRYTTCSTVAGAAAKVATLATFNLVAGAKISVKFTNANTATAPTLNISSKGAVPLKKADGTPFTNIKAGVYTFIYDGSGFIVQGEGGEYGTATSSQVLEGLTIGTEFGIVNGTMPNNTSRDWNMPALAVSHLNGSVLLKPPAGYYSGESWLGSYQPNLKPENIKSGVNVFGVQGTLKPKNFYYRSVQGFNGEITLSWDFPYDFMVFQTGATGAYQIHWSGAPGFYWGGGDYAPYIETKSAQSCKLYLYQNGGTYSFYIYG